MTNSYVRKLIIKSSFVKKKRETSALKIYSSGTFAIFPLFFPCFNEGGSWKSYDVYSKVSLVLMECFEEKIYTIFDFMLFYHFLGLRS